MTHTPMAAISHTFQLATRTPGQLRPPAVTAKMSSTGTGGPGVPKPRPFPTAGPANFVPSQHFSALNLNRGPAGTLNNVCPPNMEDRILGARHLGPGVQQSNR